MMDDDAPGLLLRFPSERRAAASSDADEPHQAGMAVCGACRHQWSAVAPVGETHLNCPQCRRMWGTFKNAVEPEVAWRCNCGEMLFFLTPDGAMCRRCGCITTDWA